MMKVFPHAALLIPLSIFLLLVLPYEVNGRSRQKQLKEEEKKKDEYETGRIRKRDSSMKLSEHFKGDNLAKACTVCHKLYDIDEGNCVAGKRRAKYNCMVKAKENSVSFKAKFHESESSPSAPAPESAPPAPSPESAPAPSPSGGGGSPPSGDDLFKPEYLEKTCRICGKIGGVNEDECKSDQNRAREYCKMTTTEMKKKFNDNWEAGGDSSDEDGTNRVRKRYTAERPAWYFLKDNLAKSCAVCKALFAIDEANCIAGKEKAKYNCMLKSKESRDSFLAKFHGSASESKASESAPSSSASESVPSSPASESARAPSSSGGGSVSPSADDLFRPENLEITCRICGKIGGVNVDECKSDTNGAREKCKTTSTEMKKKFNAHWKACGGSSKKSQPAAETKQSQPAAQTKQSQPAAETKQSQPAAETKKKLELPGNADDLFKPEYLEKTCKVCQVVINANYDQCVKSADSRDRKCCVRATKVRKEKFNLQWNKISSKLRAFRRRRFRV